MVWTLDGRENLFEDAGGYDVVVVGVGDFGAVEGAGDEFRVMPLFGSAFATGLR
jgi:hypothetical protein